MSALHSARAAKPVLQSAPEIGAIVYANDHYPDALFKWIVSQCRARGARLAGVLQHPAFEGADPSYDVVLEDLVSGRRTVLFDDRGPGAKGCRLDVGALLEAAMEIERSFETNPALLVLNKFGKIEVEGGGLCGVIAKAIELGIPVVIGVPARNLEAFRNFADEFASVLPEDIDQVGCWLARLG